MNGPFDPLQSPPAVRRHDDEIVGPQLKALYQVDKERVYSIVREALEAQDGNVAAAAKQLSMGKRTLWTWIQSRPGVRAGLKNAKLHRVVE